MQSTSMPSNEEDVLCLVCSALATGFHFGAQSCSACAAFFRRTVALEKVFVCITGHADCRVHYSMHQICRSCRFDKCGDAGMNPNVVQPRRSLTQRKRTFYTASGLKRNKHFSDMRGKNEEELETKEAHFSPSSSTSPSSSREPAPERPIGKEPDVLSILIREEMRLGERRRILFCESPIERLLGANSQCPYTKADIRPLSFRAFRKSVRTHVLLCYDWLQTWPHYDNMTNNDRVSFLRQVLLFHTILDPAFITIQIGFPEKLIMQNGGYVSCVEGCDSGWEDECEISGKTKKLVYGPIVKRVMEDIIPPILQMGLSFEEFVALKAYVSWQGAVSNIVEPRSIDAIRKQLELITRSLHAHYLRNGMDAAARMGGIILLLSSVFSTGVDLLLSQHQVEVFNLWRLDSLIRDLLLLDFKT